jgi:hypothetical protein
MECGSDRIRENSKLLPAVTEKNISQYSIYPRTIGMTGSTEMGSSVTNPEFFLLDGRRGFDSRKGKDFSFLYSVQTSSEA